MSKASNQELEDSLKSYSIDVKYWEPNASDTFILLGHREFLQKQLSTLSSDQARQLAQIDQQVLALCAATYDDEGCDDIRTLRFVADLINGKAKPGATIS